MSISRKLPNTDEGRNMVLTKAKLKKDNTPPASILITPATVTRVDATQPLFASKMQLKGNALQAQTSGTSTKEAAQGKSKMTISHFFQTLFNGVERGIFPKSHLAFYQLPVDGRKVPTMDSEASVLLWGQNVITGDAARVAAGGVAMSMPSITEVTTAHNAFKTAAIAHSTLKDAYDKAQEAVAALRPDADKLILRIWDEVETALNDEPIESLRRKAREWGVVYVSDTSNMIHVTVKDSVNNSPLAATLTITETGESFTTNDEGTLDFKTGLYEAFIIHVEAAGYISQDVNVAITNGVKEYDVAVRLVRS